MQWSASQYIVLNILIKYSVFLTIITVTVILIIIIKNVWKCTHYQQRDSITQLLLIWVLLSSALPHFPVSIQETQNKIVQTPFFEEHNYNQVEKSIWECWHWSFSSFSPWLPQKMRYSKTLVKEPTKIFFAPRAVWIHRPLLSYNFSSGLFCTWIYCPYAFFSCGVECFASGFFCFFSINGTIIVAAIDIAAQQSNSFKWLVFSYAFWCFFSRL